MQTKQTKMRVILLETLLCVGCITHSVLGFAGERGNFKSINGNQKVQSTSFVMNEESEPDRTRGVPSPARRNTLEIMASIALVGSSLPMDALAASSTFTLIPSPAFTSDLSWPLGKVAFSLLPLAGTSSRRATVEECIVPDTIWTHDQIQGVVNVNVPVRQTVIRLKSGGLWIHNPVAPTPQLIRMVKSLEEKYGSVRHIVLGTVALEHKATFGAFCKNFPRATVWIQPGQWAFPVDLSIDYLGVNQRGAKFRELPVPGKSLSEKFRTTKPYPPPEWANEIEYEVLGPFKFKSVGAFSETAFYHKETKSLIVTDTVVSVTKTPPPIIQEDPRGLMFHARDNISEVVEDTPSNRERGWRRMVQFGLVFFPSQITVESAGDAIREARNIDPRMSNLGDGAVPFNLYPWKWNGDADITNFEAISQRGKVCKSDRMSNTQIFFNRSIPTSRFLLSLTAFLSSYSNKADLG